MRSLVFATIVAIIAILAVACNGGEEGLRTATPEPSPSATPAVMPAVTPTPALAQTPLGPAQPVALKEGAPVTEAGVYLVEVSTGRLWRVDVGHLWSPDGNALLSWGCCTGRGGLDVIDVPAGPAVRLLSGDMADAAWSPDGTQIYFSPAEGSLPAGLYAINRDGSGLKRVSETVTSVGEWSPRGDRMAFQDRGLHLLEVATGHVSQIPDATDWPWHPWSFAWSPDGRALAFTNDSGLHLYEPDTGERRQLAVAPSSWPVLWSPDGSRIAFRFGPRIPLAYGAYAHDPEAGIQIPHVVEVDGTTEPKPLPMAAGLSWSPDGSRMAYLEHGCITGNFDVYTIQPDGSSTKQLTNIAETAMEGPFWSPTGSAIAFSTFDELMVVDADSGETRTLAVSGGPEGRYTGIHLHASPWSPDGRYMAFHAGGAHGICD